MYYSGFRARKKYIGVNISNRPASANAEAEEFSNFDTCEVIVGVNEVLVIPPSFFQTFPLVTNIAVLIIADGVSNLVAGCYVFEDIRELDGHGLLSLM